MIKVDARFRYLFWFCAAVFLLSFSAMMLIIYVPVPESNEGMANNTQGFLQGSLIMSAIGFLLTGNINTTPAKKPVEGTTTAEVSATITTEPTENPNQE